MASMPHERNTIKCDLKRKPKPTTCSGHSFAITNHTLHGNTFISVSPLKSAQLCTWLLRWLVLILRSSPVEPHMSSGLHKQEPGLEC